MKKPIIGVVSKNLTLTDFYNWSWQRISGAVHYAVCKNGGLVMGILPQTTRTNFNDQDEHENVEMTEEEKSDLIEMLKLCDGIILQGGITSHNYEEFIARYCYQNDIPCIGICAGYNNIIRAFGGKADKIASDEEDIHDRPDLKYAHKCKVVDLNSKFYDIVGEKEFFVNSVHTYVGREIPKELSVVAYSDDGQVEVVEAKDKDFFIGIKYHPELLVDSDQIQNNIFKRFIEITSKQRG